VLPDDLPRNILDIARFRLEVRVCDNKGSAESWRDISPHNLTQKVAEAVADADEADAHALLALGGVEVPFPGEISYSILRQIAERKKGTRQSGYR